MFKKVFSTVLLLSTLSLAEDTETCKFYPVKKMEPLYYGQFLIDRVEYTNKDNLNYEITTWYGGDYRRVWVEIEGEHNTKNNEGSVEKLDILYGKLITAFWDIRGGVGYTGTYGDIAKDRTMLVLGLKGLAPYWFEVDTNIRLTNKGEVYGDFEAEYDLLFTQRLILQPRIDTTFSFSEIPEIGIGSGINNIEISFRLRYEFKREFAPYVGFSYTKLFGKTKDYAEQAGEDTSYFSTFIGLRMWF